jgi:hypothetical protein
MCPPSLVLLEWHVIGGGEKKKKEEEEEEEFFLEIQHWGIYWLLQIKKLGIGCQKTEIGRHVDN